VPDRWTVVRSNEALSDIEAIWRYLLEIDESLAERFLDRIENTILSLIEFPERGGLRAYIGMGVRGLLVSPWLVLYRANRATVSVEIVRVIDARRDMTGLTA
jgi:plasmid stabilization system protein ParE